MITVHDFHVSVGKLSDVLQRHEESHNLASSSEEMLTAKSTHDICKSCSAGAGRKTLDDALGLEANLAETVHQNRLMCSHVPQKSFDELFMWLPEGDEQQVWMSLDEHNPVILVLCHLNFRNLQRVFCQPRFFLMVSVFDMCDTDFFHVLVTRVSVMSFSALAPKMFLASVQFHHLFQKNRLSRQCW